MLKGSQKSILQNQVGLKTQITKPLGCLDIHQEVEIKVLHRHGNILETAQSIVTAAEALLIVILLGALVILTLVVTVLYIKICKLL